MNYLKIFLYLFVISFQLKSQQALDFSIGGAFESVNNVRSVKMSVDTINNFCYITGTYLNTTDFDFGPLYVPLSNPNPGTPQVFLPNIVLLEL